jgi:outer membrane cobalamin receptor
MRKLLLVAFALFIGATTFAQTTFSGTVTDDKSGEPLPGVNIKISRKAVGTTTDFDGKFTLKVTDAPPFTIELSTLGYKTIKVDITKNNQVVSVGLTENATSLDEVIVSASRTPERIMESPVTIERMDIRAIRNTSSPSFYDGLENLKGVDINTNSFTFKSVNTRGFATFANTRFMQLVDGMDNSSPALNFALGNLLGMSELDVKTIELLPGASSALYGANAFNGIMFMTSKSPFDDQGISYVYKSGITSQKAAGDNMFYDTSIRMAHAFSDYFAAKATLSYLKGTEWAAVDYRDEVTGVNDRATNPGYNGLNVYGDEVATTLNFEQIALANGVPAFIASTMGSTTVSRTGYNEEDLMGDEAKSVKMGISLNYRPWGNDRLEIIWNSKYGTGNTIYQGTNRYSIKNFFMEQHKLEFKGKNFFVRGYMTAESAGDSYDTRFAAININRAWKSDQQWFTEYAGAYVQTYVGTILAGGTPNPGLIHQQARGYAQMGALVPGTSGFQSVFNTVTSDPSLITGSKFTDNTRLYHVDANLNLRDYIDFADIQVGGSFREYSLRSNGTIFTDIDGPINYNEYGAYVQGQKKFMDDRLKVTASARYDKAQNFDGNVSPRMSLSYALGEDKNHNLRGSVQTGFRNPTTQDQYIGLDAGRALLIGTAPDNLDRYTSAPILLGIPAGLAGYINATTASNIGSTASITGRGAYENSWSLSSLYQFLATGNPGLLKKANIDLVKPERVTAFEAGYRGIIEGVTIDFSAYYNQYEDFIASKNVIAPLYGKADFSDLVDLTPLGGGPTPISLVALSNGDYKVVALYTNSTADISSYGASIGLSTKIFNGFSLGANYTYAKFTFDEASDPDFEAGFNTPEHKVKVQFGNPNMFKNFGFNVNLRWQDEFLWQSTFYDATIAARTTVDAQINFRIPQFKSTLKIGGANLGGKEYFSAPGVGAIGSQYYVSWTINP